MDKESLYPALFLLMTKLEWIKNNSMKDEAFVAALTVVLRYFRDNGELKEAFKYNESILKDIESKPFYKNMVDLFCSNVNEECPDLPQFDINKVIQHISSDAFIDDKIKSILE